MLFIYMYMYVYFYTCTHKCASLCVSLTNTYNIRMCSHLFKAWPSTFKKVKWQMAGMQSANIWHSQTTLWVSKCHSTRKRRFKMFSMGKFRGGRVVAMMMSQSNFNRGRHPLDFSHGRQAYGWSGDWGMFEKVTELFFTVSLKCKTW